MDQVISLLDSDNRIEVSFPHLDGDTKYPQLICGLSSFLHPLAPNKENAFNPCFISWLYIVTAVVFGTIGLVELLVFFRRKTWYGNLLPKNTGFNHWIRCNSVLIQVLLYIVLTFTATNIHARYADFKILAQTLITITLAFVILPLHITEVVVTATPRPILLAFWPILIILQLILLFQDNFTNWPLLSARSDTFLFALEVFSIFNSVSVVLYESILWKPSHDLIYNYKLEGYDYLLEQPNLYSILTFTWMNPLIEKAYVNKTLTTEDLPSISNELSAELETSKLTKVYTLESNGKTKGSTFRLFKLLALAFGGLVFAAFVCEVGSLILSIIQPQLLGQLIKFFGDFEKSGGDEPIIRALIIAISMFIITIFRTWFDNQYVLLILKAGLGCRSSLTSLLFQKSLILSAESKSKYATGEIVNLVSTDVDRIQQLTQNIQTLFVAPIELILCLISLYYFVGWKPTLASCAVLAVLVPLNSFIIKLLKRLRKSQLKFTDLRSRTINDILTSIKSIKLYSWESPMNEKLQDVRINQELKNLKKIRFVNIFGNLIWILIPFCLTFTTFAVFALTLDIPLTSDIVFPTLSLLNMLSGPLLSLPGVITQLVDTTVSLTRIAEFLVSSEIDGEMISKLTKADKKDDTVVEIKNTSFLWEKPVDPGRKDVTDNGDLESAVTSVKYALKNINFETKKAQLHCIVGKVGSGKSTFLTSLLGQLEAVNSSDPINKLPEVSIRGSIAYCAQTPWIMNSTVKDNILFGHEYDENFYQRTIDCCQLAPDIKVLPDGDATFVGEKGISLSGGQKARLSLARAVYARGDVYLLDDVLSAVDSHVGKQIIEKVLSRELGILKTKTIILATNSLLVLNYSNSIDLLERGEIVERGTFSEILESEGSNGKLYTLLKEFGKHGPSTTPSAKSTPIPSAIPSTVTSTVTSDNEEEVTNELTRTLTNASLEAATLAPFKWVSLSNIFHTKTNAKPKQGQNLDAVEETPVSLRTKKTVEKQALGSVKLNVYKEYIDASSRTGSIVWFISIVTSCSFSVASNYWLKNWAEQNSNSGNNEDAIRYIGIYALLGFGSSLFILIRSALLWTYLSINASRNIHDRMSKSIFTAPMSFFERTPIGRIMNRFTSDINRVDDVLPRAFGGFFNSTMSTIFTLGVIAVVVPSYTLVIAALSIAYFYYQKHFLSISRELKRLVSVSRSPIYAHFQETLNGVDTVRAFNQIDRFKYLDDANLDFNLKSLYMLRSSNRWLSSRLQFIGSMSILSASTLSILTLLTKSPLTAGTAGFVMTYALQTSSSLSFVVRMSAEVESTIVAFERCLEYCELPEEQPDDVGQYEKLPENFPVEGSIKFVNYATRYRANLDLILKNVSFEIKGKEKIGVVGRTGAGKSSLTLALFRIIEAVEGSIFIDGVDISKLSVYDLRRHLLIIPQDSQAFEGTVRQNLDPFSQYSDEEIWKVLELAHLKDHLEEILQSVKPDEPGQESTSSGLLYKVSEGGSNFSAGQLQLMCLARALLNKSKIIVLDEATAAVDVQTDKIIQDTIRKHFKDRTIITIAHRLDTVMDCDRIISLDHGELKEFDSPENLLKNKDSIFYNLCEQGGYLK